MRERNVTLKDTVLRRPRAAGRQLQALAGVTFNVDPGEAVAIVGQNGSGKSTLLKVIAGIILPDTGTVRVGGSIASMLELGAGFHPDFSGRENVYMNGAIYGLGAKEIDKRLEEIIAFAEVEEFVDMPIRTYSSGMYMRLAFSIAAHVNPDVLLLDEVLAVGDEAFQRKCMARIAEFRRAGGTLIFVSHDPVAVQNICDRAVVIAAGRVVADGATSDALDAYHRILAEPSEAGVSSRREGPSLPRYDEAAAVALPGLGDLRAAITAASVRNRAGRPAKSFATGDPLTVELEIRAGPDVRAPVIATEIRSEVGTCIFGTNTRLEEVSIDVIGDRAVLRWHVARLPLFEGLFWVAAAILSEDLAVTHHLVEKVVGFSVFQQGKGMGLLLIDTSYEWYGDRRMSELDGHLSLEATEGPETE